MLYFIFNWFVKITGFIPVLIAMPFKTHYSGPKAQSRRIKGKAIVVSNHRTVWDFGLMIFLFWTRSLRCVVGEIMYQKTSLDELCEDMDVNRKELEDKLAAFGFEYSEENNKFW